MQKKLKKSVNLSLGALELEDDDNMSREIELFIIIIYGNTIIVFRYDAS